MTFSEKLYTLRRERGLSQEQLAEALNVSRQAISKWENGSAMPESDKLIALSRYFGLTLDALIGGEDGGAFSQQSTPAPIQSNTRLHKIGGLTFCAVGAICLAIWALLLMFAPEKSEDIGASSAIALDGNAILLLVCVAAIAAGAYLLIKGYRKH